MTRAVRPALLLLCTLLTGCTNAVNIPQEEVPRFGTNGRTERSALNTRTPARITVVTFNIKYGRRIDRAIEVLRLPPLRTADVIALQEIDEEDAQRIAAALELEYAYYPANVHPVERRNMGSAVLSAWPIERAWRVRLPHESWARRQQRTATGAILRLGEVRVRFYSVHLELPLSLFPWARSDQVEHLLCDAADAREPVVIAGDFNGPDVAYLLEDEGYRWLTRDVGPSAAIFRADHIFVRGLAAVEREGVGIVEDVRGASDHRPVWGALAVPAPGAVLARPPEPRYCATTD